MDQQDKLSIRAVYAVIVVSVVSAIGAVLAAVYTGGAQHGA